MQMARQLVNVGSIHKGRKFRLDHMIKRHRSSASVRHRSTLWNIFGLRLERGRDWTGDLLIVDTEDLETIPPSEIHVKGSKSKEVDIQKKTMKLCAGRVKSCKKDSSYPPLSTKREAISGKNLNTDLQKKHMNMKPEIQVQMLTLDKFSDVPLSTKLLNGGFFPFSEYFLWCRLPPKSPQEFISLAIPAALSHVKGCAVIWFLN